MQLKTQGTLTHSLHTQLKTQGTLTHSLHMQLKTQGTLEQSLHMQLKTQGTLAHSLHTDSCDGNQAASVRHHFLRQKRFRDSLSGEKVLF